MGGTWFETVRCPLALIPVFAISTVVMSVAVAFQSVALTFVVR
jgi:hypothetical protein